MAWLGHAEPITFQLYNEDLQKFRLAAQGHGDIQPPDAQRLRIETYFDPLPIWYQPFLERDEGGEEFPVHALSQRPMHMYHSWGSQNAWLRQITSANKLHMHRELAAKHDPVGRRLGVDRERARAGEGAGAAGDRR